MISAAFSRATTSASLAGVMTAREPRERAVRGHVHIDQHAGELVRRRCAMASAATDGIDVMLRDECVDHVEIGFRRAVERHDATILRRPARAPGSAAPCEGREAVGGVLHGEA